MTKRKPLTIADLVPGCKFVELWGLDHEYKRKYTVCALVDDQIVVKCWDGTRWLYSIRHDLYYKMMCEDGRIISR